MTSFKDGGVLTMVTFDYWTANNEPTAELGYIISFLKSAHLLITLLQVLKCPYG